MRMSSVRHAFLALISLTLAGLLTAPGNAQQPAPAKPPAPAGVPTSPSPASGSASAPAATTAASPDKVVLKVGDQQVTQAELDLVFANLNSQAQQTMSTQGRRPFGDSYALMILLSKQAVNDHLDSSPSVRQTIALQRLQALAQAEYSQMASQAKVSPEEISQYYSTHAAEFDEAKVRQVVVRKKPEGSKEGTPGLTPEEARTRIDSIRKALAAGSDAKKVAEDFRAPNDVAIDAEPRTFRRGQLPANFDKPMFELKDGELSEPLDTPQALVVLQIVGHRHAELKEVSAAIENMLRQQKLEAAVADLKKTSPVWMDEEYFKAPQAPPAPTPVPSAPTRTPQS